MDRETRVVALKRSKGEATIVTYFTRKENVLIDRAKWSKMVVVEKDGESKPADFNPDFIVAEQDESLRQGIKKLVFGDKIYSGETLTFEVIENLPDEDVKKILDEFNKNSGGDKIDDTKKKKH